MKKITLLLLLLVSSVLYSQQNGITYQAIILNPDGVKIPNVSKTNSPLVNKKICLQFTIVDAASKIEYQETINTTTDGFGMVNTIIGSGNQSAGYALSFMDIYWSTDIKSLKVALDINGKCTNFIEISNQTFTSVPSAFSALNAENVIGVVSIENGGTNAITVLGAKTNLALENVDNTSDLNKPISLATQTALNQKEVAVNKSLDLTIDGSSDVKYPTTKAVKTYVDASVSTTSTALATEVARATAAEGVLTTSIANEASTRGTADATLTTNLNAEISRATAAETANANAITAEATTARAAELANATAITAEITRATAAEATKENTANKSNDGTLASGSDVKFPTEKAVKTYVDASVSTTSTALATEVARATAAEDILTTSIANEASTRATADATLTTNLNAEISRATAAETANANAITAEVTAARAAELANATAITAETARATAAEATKENTANKSNDGTLASNSDVKFPTEKAVKTYVDASSSSGSAALATEVARATAAEGVLTTSIANEASTRGTADATLTTNLNAEISRATAAETANVNAITAEATTARAAELANATAITAETTRATAAEAGLTSSLALKVDKISGKGLSTEDYSSAEKTKLAAITGTNTGDQDLSTYAPLASPTFTGTVSGITKTMVGLGNVDNTTDLLKPISTATQSALDLKADLASPTFTGTVSGITKTMVGLGSVDNTTDLLKPISTATQSALDLKANLASPTFTGTVSGITKTMVGLGNVDNTTDLLKPISTATQSALDLKADLASPTFTGTVSGITKTMVGLGSVDNTTDLLKPISIATQSALALKANLASPTFTGTVSGITKTMVELGNVDNTTDLLKPISTATQSALDLKADLASPTFTGTVSGITKTMVELGNVDNTTDLLKPISTATQSALDLKANLASPTFTGTVTASGTLTSGVVTYPNSHGTSGQVLSTTGSGTLAWSTPSTTANAYSGVLPLANGGTGSATQNFVDLTTTQTVAGAKTFSSTVTGSSFVKSGGTSIQYLMADGTVSSGPREVNAEFTATASQTNFTVTQTPLTGRIIKMYVNGVRISNTACSFSGTTLTYIPSNNGNYNLTAGDRIQMDFYY